MDLIKVIVVLMAMQQEAQPLIDKMGFVPLDGIFDVELPMKAYQAKVGETTVYLVLNGTDTHYNVESVATQPATIASFLSIKELKPDLLINAGTAGGMSSRNAKIGTVFLSADSIKFHDRRIPLQGYDEYGIGNYSCLDATKMSVALGFPSGIVSTGNSLHMTPEDFAIIAESGAVVKEMEAAAIAWVAQLYRIPFLAVKSVTNLIDTEKPSHEDFEKNLSLASRNLQVALEEVLNYCADKPLEDL